MPLLLLHTANVDVGNNYCDLKEVEDEGAMFSLTKVVIQLNYAGMISPFPKESLWCR